MGGLGIQQVLKKNLDSYPSDVSSITAQPLCPPPPPAPGTLPGQIKALLTLSIVPWEAWSGDDSAWAAVARWAQALAGSLGTTQPRTHSQNRPHTGWDEGWGRVHCIPMAPPLTSTLYPGK